MVEFISKQLTMYLRVNYQSHGSEITGDLLLTAAALLPEIRHKEAIALDGLRVIFQTLEESSIRLENKLIGLKNVSARAEGSPVSFEEQTAITSIMSEVWIIVDNIRRLPLFLRFIPGIPEHIAGAEFAFVISEVKGLRDSLHHIDERVKKYFSRHGESILGDILWRSRITVEENEALFFLRSGVSRLEQPITHVGKVQDARFLERLGVYDLRLRYVTRPYDAATKVYAPEVTTEVNIENAINVVNRVIKFLNEKYSDFYRDSVVAGGTFSADVFPNTIGIRIKKLECDALNPKSEDIQE